MNDSRHSALLTVIVPMVIGEIVKNTGLDEKTAAARFYASRVYRNYLTNLASCGIIRQLSWRQCMTKKSKPVP